MVLFYLLIFIIACKSISKKSHSRWDPDPGRNDVVKAWDTTAAHGVHVINDPENAAQLGVPRDARDQLRRRPAVGWPAVAAATLRTTTLLCVVRRRGLLPPHPTLLVVSSTLGATFYRIWHSISGKLKAFKNIEFRVNDLVSINIYFQEKYIISR